jgi:glutamate racemase
VKLGVFDSGMGGLLITKSVRERMPEFDMLYYGDTLHLPYGNRSEEAIYMYAQRAMDFMFAQGCGLIVMACNTASASALRRLQQTWLPTAYAGRNILGVVVPTLEVAASRGYKKIGLIGTNYTIKANVYEAELQKIDPDIRIIQRATPLLVPMIENDGMRWIDAVLKHYLDPILAERVECLILGCTHYAMLKDKIRAIAGDKLDILSQDDIIPAKLEDYIRRHPEYKLSRGGTLECLVSDLTDSYVQAARDLIGASIDIRKAA